MSKQKGHVATVFSDGLMRACVVVELPDASLWLVPNSADGWDRRVRLTLTAEKRADRLRLAKGDFRYLGIPDNNERGLGA